jgi:hypothetical protein
LTATTRRAVAAAIADLLADEVLGGGPLSGLTSLAEGADQVFAHELLAAGGDLRVVVPSRDYDASFASDTARAAYTALLSLAAEVTTLAFDRPGENAYLAAGRLIVDRCDVLVAVWDGQQAAGVGGTGDIVSYARSRGRTVRVLWPDHARRQ